MPTTLPPQNTQEISTSPNLRATWPSPTQPVIHKHEHKAHHGRNPPSSTCETQTLDKQTDFVCTPFLQRYGYKSIQFLPFSLLQNLIQYKTYHPLPLHLFLTTNEMDSQTPTATDAAKPAPKNTETPLSPKIKERAKTWTDRSRERVKER